MTPTTNNVGPTTSATDELRRLLDERGVEWRGGLPTETMVEADGLDLLYVALPDGRVRAFIRNYLTPEQAIEATLGRGTCRMCKRKGYDREYLHHYECSECGEEVLRSSVMGESEPPRFCPECGRRVEQ